MTTSLNHYFPCKQVDKHETASQDRTQETQGLHYKTALDVPVTDGDETRNSENLSISEEIQAVENRISKELGIQIQLVGQVAAREALPGEEVPRAKWAFPREPSPINSSTRTSTPVRAASDRKAASLNASISGSHESINKTKMNYSDGDATLNTSERRNRPEPLRKPDIDPRKIKDYEELRKMRLALMLQAFTGREDTDALLEETKSKADVNNPVKVPATVSPASTPNATDQETISARVKEIIARYSDSNTQNAPEKQTVMTNASNEKRQVNDRKAQPTKVPFYNRPRRQIYPHKRNYRPPGSETESETDNETSRKADGSMNKDMHSYVAPTHEKLRTDGEGSTAPDVSRHKGYYREYDLHDSPSSHTSRRPRRSYSPRRSARHRLTSSEQRSQDTKRQARHPPSPRQTNLNYRSTSSRISNTSPTLYANVLDSNDEHQSYNHTHASSNTPKSKFAKHEGVEYSDTSFEGIPEDESNKNFETAPKNKAALNSYSSHLHTSDVRDSNSSNHSYLRDTSDNIRRSPRNTTHVSNTEDSLDTDALVAKYLSPQSSVPSPRNIRKSDLDFSLPPETETRTTRRRNRNDSIDAPWKKQNFAETLNERRECLNEGFTGVTASSGSLSHWKEPKLYDNRYGTPSSQRSLSPTYLTPPLNVTSQLEGSANQPSGSTHSSPKSPSFPWHSNRGSNENLDHHNVTDEEKRRQASSSTSLPSRHTSRAYREPASPRYSPLTCHSSRPSSDSSTLTPSNISDRYGSGGLRTSTSGVRSSLSSGLTSPRSSTYQRPSESLTRHTISSSLKSGATRVHQVGNISIFSKLNFQKELYNLSTYLGTNGLLTHVSLKPLAYLIGVVGSLDLCPA